MKLSETTAKLLGLAEVVYVKTQETQTNKGHMKVRS